MDNTLPRTHCYLFGLLLAAYSTFFAEVFAGSDMFPFFHAWGLLVVVPLYGLHTIILLTLIYRCGGRPRFSSLVFAGMLFGLYEAYMTKVLWKPGWGAAITLGDVAVVEVFVLVFWWHAWFSFITPLVLGEGLLTTSRDVLLGLPLRLRRFYGSWKGWLTIALFGAAFQSINSPSPLHSLASGAGTVGVLALLTALWRRVTRGRTYALSDLLPGKGEFRLLAAWLGALYLFLGTVIYPERLPPVWPGQVIVWGLYALVIALFLRALRRTRPLKNIRSLPAFSPAKTLLGLGLSFVFALPLMKILLGGAAEVIVLGGWGMGIFLGVWAFALAVREIFPRRRRKPRPKLHARRYPPDAQGDGEGDESQASAMG